jgi:hypothetical protein
MPSIPTEWAQLDPCFFFKNRCYPLGFLDRLIIIHDDEIYLFIRHELTGNVGNVIDGAAVVKHSRSRAARFTSRKRRCRPFGAVPLIRETSLSTSATHWKRVSELGNYVSFNSAAATSRLASIR